jgi:hypothetical protein
MRGAIKNSKIVSRHDDKFTAIARVCGGGGGDDDYYY